MKEVVEWNEVDDGRLMGLTKHNEKICWSIISKQLGGRTAAQCLKRWEEITKRESKKGGWSLEEDEQLKQWVSPCLMFIGHCSWTV